MVLILLLLTLTKEIHAKCLHLPPFKAGSSHRVVQGFNGSYSHKAPLQFGTDFEMPIGTLVHASREGTVSQVVMHNHESGTDKSFINKANKITIDHGDGTFSLYAHLKKGSARVIKNQKVEAGLPIARSGCTGWCEGAHLHFEVFKKENKERRTVPYQFITKSGCTIPKFGSQVKNQFLKRR